MGSLERRGLLQQEVGHEGQTVLVPDIEDEPCDSGPASDVQRVLTVSPSASAERKGRACRELLFCLATHLSGTC